MPLSARYRHPDRLHTVTMPGSRAVHPASTAAPENCAVPLLLRRRDHVVTFPTPPPLSPSSPPGPRHQAITTMPGKHIVLPAITITGSTPPSRHHHARGTAPSSRSSPPPSPRLPGRHHHARGTLSISLSLSLYKFCFAVFAYMIVLRS
jgi:hypothetical protein